jgi:peptidoglycan hydrolase CwlO-like protein
VPHLINHSSLPQRTFAAALCCTLSLAAFPCYAQAAPTSQELAQERKELEAELAEAQGQLDQLEGEIEEIQQELAEREAQLEATREEADATKVQVDETNQQLTERRGELGSHMRDSYKMGSSNLMRFLLGATSFEDLASRIYYLDKVSEARAEEIDEVNRLAAELATRQQELEEAQARQQAEVEEVESKTTEYEDMIAQAQEYYDGLDEEVRAKIAEEEAAREAEEAARKAAEEAARKAEEEQKSKDSGSGTAAGGATSASPSSEATSTQDFGSVSSVSVASGVYEQSEPAMVGFNTQSYTTVANQYFGIQSSKNYQHMGNYNSSKQRLSYAGGDMSLEFETYVQLPVTLDYSGDLGNPQAVCISADGSTAYVSYPEGHSHDSSQMGRIVRYNLALLREYGAMEGDMSAFATGVRLGDEKWRSCMTVGPRINMGHGQCMAIDPSTGYLWLSTRGASEYSDLTLIDTGSLNAVRQIRFHTGGTDFGSVITFDEYGNFYYVKRSGSTWGSSPAGSLRIYQGRISDNLDKVLIKLLPQSVKNPAGTTLQSVSWDTTTDTLYVINDSAILAVSMNPLLSGSLTAGNVRTEFFSPLREFEGMAFDAGGRAYLLVNRQAELMCLG